MILDQYLGGIRLWVSNAEHIMQHLPLKSFAKVSNKTLEIPLSFLIVDSKQYRVPKVGQAQAREVLSYSAILWFRKATLGSISSGSMSLSM